MTTRIRPRPPYYSGWPAWRESQRKRRCRPLPATCPTCWNQGHIWEPGPLGLMPVVCPDCLNVR